MFKKLMDEIARGFGYYTLSDLEECVSNAKEGLAKAEVKEFGQSTLPDDVLSSDLMPPIPPDYIRYYVSFSFNTTRSFGFHCMEIGLPGTIKSIDNVLSIHNFIKGVMEERRGLSGVGITILNWKRLEGGAPDGAKEPLPNDLPQPVLLRLVA